MGLKTIQGEYDAFKEGLEVVRSEEYLGDGSL